mmetsp:Transcript_11957/g.16433  ORF Transcript_11957/g.16433 Transcript_11957/m.16433 type:complete len:80 (+) Transcript_11957:629-868(+)
MYQIEFFTGKDDDGWKKSLNGPAVEYINKLGPDYGIKVFNTNFNFSEDEAKVVGVISWSKMVETNLAEMRSPGCCCTIF